jgi:ribosome-associated protein
MPTIPKMKDMLTSTLDADKAEEIEVIDLKNQSSALADYMIIATGRSSRQVSALADKLVDVLSKIGIKNVRVEGQRHGDWVVVDAGDIIVHLFRPEVREFYNIEKMWRAGALFETA